MKKMFLLWTLLRSFFAIIYFAKSWLYGFLALSPVFVLIGSFPLNAEEKATGIMITVGSDGVIKAGENYTGDEVIEPHENYTGDEVIDSDGIYIVKIGERSIDKGVIPKAGEADIGDKDKIIKLGNNYVGLFVASSEVYNRLVDPEGFANWGHPGSSVHYNDVQLVGGALVGKKFDINGVPVRFELDGTFGDMSASTNQLDPEGLDETAKADILWLLTARAGIEGNLGFATLLVNSGLALWPGFPTLL